MDAAVAALWEQFESLSWLTHTPLFEAHVAVFSFVAWILLFESAHFWIPNAEKYRLDGQPPVNPLSGFGCQLHETLVLAVTYLVSIYAFQACNGAALFGSSHMPIEAFDTPSFARVATETSLGVFLYDLCFYPFHFGFHAIRSRRVRSLHSRHHQFAAQERVAHNGVETVQNSYLDAGIQVFINICVQHVSPWGLKHPLSRILHNMMVTYLLTEAHSGYGLPFQSHRLFPAIFGGAPRHEQHHQRGGTCFHQFFMWLDDLHGLGPSGGLGSQRRPPRLGALGGPRQPATREPQEHHSCV